MWEQMFQKVSRHFQLTSQYASRSGIRKLCTNSAPLERPLGDFTVVKLSGKSIVKLSGSDVYPFLQGIITNDMQCLQHDCTSLYTQLLNIKGRVLCDLMLYKCSQEPSDVLVEVDNNQTDLLIRALKKYKIRKKVKIEDQTESMTCFAAFGCLQERPTTSSALAAIYKDPRLHQLGWKVISADSLDTDVKTDEDLYRIHRYKLGVGEGPIEHIPEKSLPLECNSVILNGVSFNKGCFIGQELTSRSHHTGVIRKRIMPVTYNKDRTLEASSDVKLCSTDKLVGTVRGAVNGYGIALLRVNEVLKHGASLYTTDSNGSRLDILTRRPTWWPEGVGVV